MVDIFKFIWVEELEEWFYLKGDERFDSSELKEGYTEYIVEVEDGIIVGSSWQRDDVGKKFEDCYDVGYWELQS